MALQSDCYEINHTGRSLRYTNWLKKISFVTSLLILVILLIVVCFILINHFRWLSFSIILLTCIIVGHYWVHVTYKPLCLHWSRRIIS